MALVDVSELDIIAIRSEIRRDKFNAFKIHTIGFNKVTPYISRRYYPTFIYQISLQSKNGSEYTHIYIENSDYQLTDFVENIHTALQVEVEYKLPKKADSCDADRSVFIPRVSMHYHPLSGTQIFRCGRGRREHFLATTIDIFPSVNVGLRRTSSGQLWVSKDPSIYSQVILYPNRGYASTIIRGPKPSMFSFISSMKTNLEAYIDKENGDTPF